MARASRYPRRISSPSPLHHQAGAASIPFGPLGDASPVPPRRPPDPDETGLETRFAKPVLTLEGATRGVRSAQNTSERPAHPYEVIGFRARGGIGIDRPQTGVRRGAPLFLGEGSHGAGEWPGRRVARWREPVQQALATPTETSSADEWGACLAGARRTPPLARAARRGWRRRGSSRGRRRPPGDGARARGRAATACPNRHRMPVHLHAVGTDDFSAARFGQPEREIRLPKRPWVNDDREDQRPRDRSHRRPTLRSNFVPARCGHGDPGRPCGR